MKIGITGATGLIGRELCRKLLSSEHQIRLFVRRPAKIFDNAEQITCDLLESPPSSSSFDGLDAIIHLAGESIAEGRWSKKRKERIWDSRVQGTRNLVNACLDPEISTPATLICASAVGFYGDRGVENLTEESSPGEGWLARLSQAWEREALRLKEVGTRVILLRIGIVLSSKGGALPKMERPFRLGLGGKLGSGDQYMSWIHISDLVRLIEFSLFNDSVNGPVNATSNAITNIEFTKTLASVLNRPSVFAAPSLMLRIALGEMADALLLSSQKVIPRKARKAGFHFEFDDLELALKDLLG